MATKKDLINAVKDKLGYLDEKDTTLAVNCIFDYIKEELVAGNRIELRGFGSISVRKRKYINKDEEYNTVYYRMSKKIQSTLNAKLL